MESPDLLGSWLIPDLLCALGDQLTSLCPWRGSYLPHWAGGEMRGLSGPFWFLGVRLLSVPRVSPWIGACSRSRRAASQRRSTSRAALECSGCPWHEGGWAGWGLCGLAGLVPSVGPASLLLSSLCQAPRASTGLSSLLWGRAGVLGGSLCPRSPPPPHAVATRTLREL